MKRLFTTLFILLISWVSLSQTHTLTGKITYKNKALPGVDISVKGQKKGSVSDLDGRYVLELPEGIYTIIFSYGSQKSVQVNLNNDKTRDIDMTDVTTALDEIFISSIRVDADSPITYSNLSNKEIKERNLGQSIPSLMKFMPNVVTTSDAGADVGYSGIRVRGSDATRVNVTINGIPLNDAESQSSVWVDLGDFSSSIENLQLQRGVGTSTNGAGAFGASLNVLTDEISDTASAEITNTYGSFDTHKHQVEFNTGRVADHFAFNGNFSIMESDGYRDRAFSKLKSYFLQGIYKNAGTTIKALGFGGTETTYQAYYGIDQEQLENDRKFNPAGMYTDSSGTRQFYDNQTDNYKQDHFQLLWNQTYNPHWSSNIAFHYTYGRGYYESYHQDATLNDYGFSEFMDKREKVTTSDLVNQKWLDNHFYGTVFDLTYKKSTLKLTSGGAYNRYTGDHYGSVVYTKFAENPSPFEHYYDNRGTKTDFNTYLKATLALTDQLSVFGDLQFREVHYKTAGPYEGEDLRVKDHFSFFNPKAGLTYQINADHQIYASYARANKEPNRGDYKSAVLGHEHPSYPEAETLNDYELGWRYKSKSFNLNSNLYYMDYHNQLVLTGAIDPEGRFIRKNSGQSYRLGLEVNADIKLTNQLSLHPNIALSENKNKNYKSTIDGEVKNYGDTKISFSPQIVGGNAIRYAATESLELNLLTKFVGEQYLGNTQVSESKLDSYFVNNLNVQYRWLQPPLFKEVIFKGLLNNIFDENYISNGTYSPSGGALYFPQAGINYLAGLTLKF